MTTHTGAPWRLAINGVLVSLLAQEALNADAHELRTERARRLFCEEALGAIMELGVKSPNGLGEWLAKLDWKKSLITRDEIVQWFDDWRRRKINRDYAVQKQLETERKKKSALMKLTKNERKLLGLPTKN